MFDHHDERRDLRRHEIALSLFSGILVLTTMMICAAVAISGELNRLYLLSERVEQKLDMLAERKERPPGGVPQAAR
ncbi:MAG: hypothetical protein VYB32_08850 [Pseudomonadota bacterium]|nr:hypothetical protein [Pseudomonadota bacterium]